jgi:voltage-gated potassium channel
VRPSRGPGADGGSHTDGVQLAAGPHSAVAGSLPPRRGKLAPLLNLTSMTGDDPTSPPKGPSFIERRALRIADARSVVIGLALTFVGLAFVGAIVIRIVDPDNFPSLGLAIWWALQTVTTVGYGDVVPTTAVGRVIGGIEMVLGISFITFLTAGVTSIVIQRGSAKAQAVERAHDEHDAKTILDALVEMRQAITELGARLDRIESKITTSG